MQLTYNKTARGFALLNFTDRSNVACNMQESSLATEAAIWIGCADTDPKRLIPGQGWTPVHLPENIMCNTRMHLTQDMVQQLLPILKHFADHGLLPTPEPVTHDSAAGLTKVIGFIEGFEGDDLQEGVPALLETARKADFLLHRNLNAWEDEEESVQEEHNELISDLRKYLGRDG